MGSHCQIDVAQIVFVDNVKTFNQAKKMLLDASVECIGLDLEMMSVELQIANAPKSCQILQMATENYAFVFDLQILHKLEDWDDFFTQIFCESDAIKIGMAWDGDLKNLRKQYPDSLAFKSICTPYLDLASISKHIRSDPEFK